MADDVIVILIQKITSELGTDNTSIQQDKDNFLTTVDNIVGVAANWAQLITLNVDVNNATDVALAAAKAAAITGASAQDVAKAASDAAEAAGVGNVVLAVVLMIGFISTLAAGSNDDSQTMQELYEGITDVRNTAGVTEWEVQMDEIYNSILPVYTDLSTIQSEGLQSVNVKTQALKFHDDAKNPVETLRSNPTVWVRPFVESLAFDGGSGQAPSLWPASQVGVTWFGNLPEPQVLPEDGYKAVFFPQYTLPAWLYGIKAWLAIYALLHEIDPNQPTFTQFQTDYQETLEDWANFLYSQYKTVVMGIIKSDLPSFDNIYGYVWNVGAVSLNPPFDPNGAQPVPLDATAWNLVYGIVDIYGVFQPRTPIPLSMPSYIIEILTPDFVTIKRLLDLTSPPHISISPSLKSLTYPWIKARLALGLIARWKALYLFLGYGRVWSILQKLRNLAKQPPDVELTLPDGTKANANWSIRELYTILDRLLQDSSPIWPGPGPPSNSSSNISLHNLMLAFDMIAKGTWAGPATNETGLIRPVSFRASLAAAALPQINTSD